MKRRSCPPGTSGSSAGPGRLPKDCKEKHRCSVDSSTLTDLHSSSSVPEVEVISLLAEDLPKYRLRADYLTEFGGYEHEDFILRTPLVPPEAAAGLSNDQAEATLEYFLLCGDRLSQMTKTYHDVEAVTRLLEEKEKDLELAAKIGQELLERNRFLDDRVAALEAQIGASNELMTQLRHELQVKTDLLHVYTNDDSVDEASPMEIRNVNVDLLQRKIHELQTDNKMLHEEATEVVSMPNKLNDFS